MFGSDKQVSVRQTRRINCLPYPQPSYVTRQKFATHVAFAPQSTLRLDQVRLRTALKSPLTYKH
jgi:hypothetical protein